MEKINWKIGAFECLRSNTMQIGNQISLWERDGWVKSESDHRSCTDGTPSLCCPPPSLERCIGNSSFFYDEIILKTLCSGAGEIIQWGRVLACMWPTWLRFGNSSWGESLKQFLYEVPRKQLLYGVPSARGVGNCITGGHPTIYILNITPICPRQFTILESGQIHWESGGALNLINPNPIFLPLLGHPRHVPLFIYSVSLPT